MLTPRQVSDSLNVPSSTIRRWAVRFENHLAKRSGKKRTYTVSDMDTFRKIRDLSGQGFGLDKIDEMLDVVESPEDQSTALLSLADFVQSLESAHNEAASLRQMITDQDARIKHLEDWITTPWYKRMGKRPPIE